MRSLFLTAVHGAPVGGGIEGIENPYCFAKFLKETSTSENSFLVKHFLLYVAEGERIPLFTPTICPGATVIFPANPSNLSMLNNSSICIKFCTSIFTLTV